MNELQQITKRMLEIEYTNMRYNKATDFGNNPNGQEEQIKAILKEWDELKVKRNQLKYSQN